MKYTDELTIRVTYETPFAPDMTHEQARERVRQRIVSGLALSLPRGDSQAMLMIQNIEIDFADESKTVELDPDELETIDGDGNVSIRSVRP